MRHSEPSAGRGWLQRERVRLRGRSLCTRVDGAGDEQRRRLVASAVYPLRLRCHRLRTPDAAPPFVRGDIRHEQGGYVPMRQCGSDHDGRQNNINVQAVVC